VIASEPAPGAVEIPLRALRNPLDRPMGLFVIVVVERV
jgi:hypothetical protein